MYGRYYGLGNVREKDERTTKRAHNVGNGVLTDPWVLTGLADRFLFMTSLLPKDVYCCPRGNLRLCLAGLEHQMREIVYKLL